MRENHLIAYPDLTDRSYAELVSLACGRAVVTGGAAGLRRQIFSRRLDAGASVLIGDLCPTAAEKTAGDSPARAAGPWAPSPTSPSASSAASTSG